LPRYEFSSGQIYGVEALLRWNPTDILNIPVEQVIAIAGDIRIISRLREWILRTACNQAAEWQRKSLKCCVSVNVSLHEFRNTDLILEIRNLIEETGLEPCHLDLEITESVIMQDVDAAAGILKNLQRLGVGIAIDDFGIGYSSINFLRRFPIKQLKIAQVLMKDVTNDADSAAVINAVIALAHSLNIKAVGEGVETEEQYRFLQEHGCDEFQGFLYGKPMPADEITRILIKQKKEL
jgi:EAL domain-containing protein (putative c-di-GMP-specific phosphodiesterase class I)